MANIEITFRPDGTTKVEGVGFKGKDCEAATKAFEDALGRTTGRRRKPEYDVKAKAHAKAGR